MQKVRIGAVFPILESAALSGKNVLLISTHGVGKTMGISSVFNKVFGVGSWKYFSASTLDPYVDLIGVPAPVHHPDGSVELKFARSVDLTSAKAIVFDEINRAHPKTLNAILEITQFRSINGVPLPNLKVVWAACNPVEAGYYTDRLDVALEDRFHLKIEIEPSVSAEYLISRGFGQNVADQACAWWNSLSPDNKKKCPPRRLEYVLQSWKDGIDGKWCFLEAESSVPIQALTDVLNRIRKSFNGFWDVVGNSATLIDEINVAKSNNDVTTVFDIGVAVMDSITNCGRLHGKNLVFVVPLLQVLPTDMVKPWVAHYRDKIVSGVVNLDPSVKSWLFSL